MASRNSAGDVTLRFSVENAEVVRQALGMIGKDGDKALRQFDASARPVPRNLAVLSEAMAQARIQGMAWSSSMGPAGAVLAAIGPSGLVAAAGIGGLILALKGGMDAAARFADDLVKLRNAAQTLDFSTMQLQALQDAGSEFAVSEDKMQAALQRLVAQLDEFRRAQGPLFEFLDRTSPALARQMLAAQSTAQAIDLLSKAYQGLTAQQQAALSRTAFGRTGFDVGLVIQGLADKGGMEGLEAAFRKSGDAIETHVIDRLTRLRTEIADMVGDARNNFAMLFSERALTAQHWMTEKLLELSRWAREFSFSDDLRRWLNLDGGAPSTRPRVVVRSGGPLNAPESGDVGLWAAGGTNEPDKVKVSAEALYNIEKKRLEFLGSAIMPMETYRLKQLELAAANGGLGVSADVATRALAALALTQGQAAVAARQRLGLLSEAEALEVGLAKLRADAANGYIVGEAEMAKAEQNLRREVRETTEAMRVQISQYPQLTRAIIDAADQARQTDGQIVRGIDAVSDGLTDAAMKTQTLAQAFTAMASSILRDMIRIQIRNTLLAGAGALMGGNSVSAGGGVIGSLFGGGTGYLHNPGGYSGAFPRPFAKGGVFTNSIFDRRTLFSFADGGRFGLGQMAEAGPEAVMPLRRGPGGRLGIDASGMASGGNVQITVINQTGTPAQASVRRLPSRRGGGQNYQVILKEAVRDVLREDLRGNGDIARDMADRFGLDPTRGM
ncbi:hypothetical protein [Pseudorhodoplanes sp.]|uniref:hypothetical protein n=1 Tax=Pseudorhodoplanes sp. TaxID=1934341 RepID=UPI003D106FF7